MIPEGLQWNQAPLSRDDPVDEVLLSLAAFTDDQSLHLIGTAFIIEANGSHAWAISAAHNFEQIRKTLNPNPLHHTSALAEFLPPPTELELEHVKALHMKDGVPHFCAVEIGIWDSAKDLAVLKITAPPGPNSYFQSVLLLDNTIPTVSDIVVMIGYGNMTVNNFGPVPASFEMSRELVGRVGRVEEVFPNGHLLLKSPCVQTSVAVFGGMSGGIVARWTGVGTNIKPFGFISFAPEPQPNRECSRSGHSMASLVDAEILALEEHKQAVAITMSNVKIGKGPASQ